MQLNRWTQHVYFFPCYISGRHADKFGCCNGIKAACGWLWLTWASVMHKYLLFLKLTVWTYMLTFIIKSKLIADWHFDDLFHLEHYKFLIVCHFFASYLCWLSVLNSRYLPIKPWVRKWYKLLLLWSCCFKLKANRLQTSYVLLQLCILSMW